MVNQISQQIIPQVESFSHRINKRKWIQFKVHLTFKLDSQVIDNLMNNNNLVLKIWIHLKTSNLHSKVKWLSFKKDKAQLAVYLLKVTKLYQWATMHNYNLSQVRIISIHHFQIWTKNFLINGQIYKTAIKKQDSSQVDQLSPKPQLNLLRQSTSAQLEYEILHSLVKIAQTN